LHACGQATNTLFSTLNVFSSNSKNKKVDFAFICAQFANTKACFLLIRIDASIIVNQLMTTKPRKIILFVEHSRITGRGLLRGIFKYSRMHGPWIFYIRPPFFGVKTKRPINLPMKKLEATGIIMDDREITEEIRSLKLPFIAIDVEDQIPNSANIVADETSIGTLAAEHFLERGFKNFAYCGFDGIYWSLARSNSFRKKLEKEGFTPHFYRQPKTNHQRLWENEQFFMADWLKSLPKPVAVMAGNDDRGQNVSQACKIASIHVPDEVAILGVDNDDLVCELSDPPISSIALNFELAGYEAAEMLDKLMSGRKLRNQTVVIHPAHIVVRKSTDVLAIEDHDVAEAIRFIRNHTKEIIQVDDVVRAVSLSRRVLEKRFHSEIGHSILKEIHHANTEYMAKMLVETTMPISKIVTQMGYSSVHNVSRYFKREKGLGLREYRKKYSLQ
jgi:LacI family transcriptional regulator